MRLNHRPSIDSPALYRATTAPHNDNAIKYYFQLVDVGSVARGTGEGGAVLEFVHYPKAKHVQEHPHKVHHANYMMIGSHANFK